MSKVTLIILVFNLYKIINGETKVWTSNTNYNNTLNWISHKLPCESSRIIFSENLDAAVLLSNKVAVKAIILPYNGELLFSSDGFIEITEQEESPTCSNKDAQFKILEIQPWLKPTNWKLLKKNINKAVPHAEQVPCIYDDVVFPTDSSFFIQYPDTSISINSFNIENQNFADEQLQEFLLSETGARQFKNFDYQQRTSVINVKEKKCLDKTGCLCHANEDITSIVCYNSKYICEEQHCFNSIQPVGHCCKICGAYLLLQFDKVKFDLQYFISQVFYHLRISGHSMVDVHINKVLYKEDTHIQIVIVDKKEYTSESAFVAEKLHEIINSKLQFFKIIKSELITAGDVYWSGSLVQKSIAMVLGTLFGVLVILSIIYIIYGPIQEKQFTFNYPFGFPKTFRPFIFAKFDNNPNGDDGLEFRTCSTSTLHHAFDNPLYDDSGPSTIKNMEETNQKINTGQEIMHKILLFSELKKQESMTDEE